jgi:hypothetical protein
MRYGLLFFASFSALGAGLERGSHFQSHFLDGEITVSCKDPRSGATEFAVFRCSAEVLEPAQSSAFLASAPTADTVKISSRELFLWQASVQQQPLLKLGQNRLTYTLFAKEKALETGTFAVNVEPGAERFCRFRRHYRSSQPGDCRSSERFCRAYFQAENNCK